MNLSKKDKQNITNTIKNLEQKSEAELVAVIARKSGEYGYFWFLSCLFIVFAVSIFLVSFYSLGALELLSMQFSFVATIFVLTFLFEDSIIKCLPSFYKHQKASLHANKLFGQLGIKHTKSHIGIMFFVSVREKYVEIVVDDGIREKIDKKYWEKVVENFVKSVKNGEFAKGYIDAINECSDILVEKFPIKDDDTNELPDEVVEI